MSASDTQATHIGHCGAPRQADALQLIFGQRDEAERDAQIATLLDSARRDAGALGFLFEARRAGRLVGAALASPQPGQTAMVWPPRLVEGEPASESAALLDAVLAKLAESPILLAQALLPVDATADAERLEAAGFVHAADLLYLVCPESAFPTSQVESALQFEPYSDENRDRFERVVGATYEETLDCPQLDGVRDITDVLAGYRATGVFAPERWLLIRYEGQDVGCLILSDYPQQDQWELIYMGVVPRRRGRSFGLDIVRHAQWLVRRAGRKRLILAVDAANHPALRMYTEAGFEAWTRRRVYLKDFSEQANKGSGGGSLPIGGG